jgi:hypothetical protein
MHTELFSEPYHSLDAPEPRGWRFEEITGFAIVNRHARRRKRRRLKKRERQQLRKQRSAK